MKRWERWCFNSATAVVAATGFLYIWMKYFLKNNDPFAVVNHPWQGATLHLHLLAAPVLILIFGVVLNSHILKKFGVARMPNRRTGLTSLMLFIAMVASGYLLQVVSGERSIRTLVIAHIGSGVLFSVAYGVHLVMSWRLSRSRPAARIREVA
jgi:hypothetical protein